MRSHPYTLPVTIGLLVASVISAVIWGGAYLIACWLIGGWA